MYNDTKYNKTSRRLSAGLNPISMTIFPWPFMLRQAFRNPGSEQVFFNGFGQDGPELILFKCSISSRE